MPEAIAFATKPEPGIAMLRGAVGPELPFAWVTADADYDKDPARQAVPARVAKAGDLLHYATARDRWERRS
ncbi:hypothetical protein ABZX85_37895 [Streptomyces sp. NPDC004539]|uniref:hypothetical protein n=1 Tax=Streptomyces sp. NPDC004539 TaxID=3154280 RepID=UPI0033A584C2